MESNIWYFDDVNLYKVLCHHKMEKSKEQSPHKFVTFKKNEFVYFEEDPSDKIYLVAQGRVKIGSYSEDGEEFIKAILTKGELFGERSLLGESKRGDFAQSMDGQTVVCPMTIDQMQSLMRSNRNLSFKINKIINFKFVKLERRLELLIFKNVKVRILEFLKDLIKEKGKEIDKEIYIDNYLTHKDMAQLIGSSRQTVTSFLNELESEKVLRFEKKNIYIKARLLDEMLDSLS